MVSSSLSADGISDNNRNLVRMSDSLSPVLGGLGNSNNGLESFATGSRSIGRSVFQRAQLPTMVNRFDGLEVMESEEHWQPRDDNFFIIRDVQLKTIESKRNGKLLRIDLKKR